jgi:predicted transglutaminase-like cysteine proteinase
VTYIIRNEGTATANETRINIRADSAGYKDYSVSVVAGGYFGDSVRLRFVYDTTHQVVVEASCDQSSDRVSLTINASLPRTLLKPYGAPSAEMLALSKLFITPNDPDVRRTLYEAMSTYVYYHLGASYHPSTSYPDWVIVNAIEDWVYNGRNVRYASDSDVHGVANYAQLPKETLQLKIGDSEDIAILFVSLLRAAGVDDDSVFVALGTNGATCYGWIRMAIEQSNDGQYAFTWYRIAPRPTGLTYYYGDIPQIDWPEQYAAVYYFNDANVVQLQH